MRVNIQGLIDNAKCYQMVRQLRWPEGVECPHCHATEIAKNGCDEVYIVAGHKGHPESVQKKGERPENEG